MRLSLTLILVATGFFIQRPLMAQGGAFLDLTLPDIRADDSTGIGCGSGRGTSGPIPEIPLSVAIDSLERTTYRVGEVVVYEIRLTNIGDKPIAIPWGRDSRIKDPCTPSSPYWNLKGPKLNALFGLRFKDQSGAETELALAALYGAMGDPETYRILKPHESALIRACDTVDDMVPHFTGELGKKLELPQTFDIHAFYHLNDSSLPNDYKTIESKESLRVTLDQRAK
jgi:hypothetical protein